MKRHLALLALLLCLPGAALAGGAQENEIPYGAAAREVEAESTPVPLAALESTYPPFDGMETTREEAISYPCTAVVAAPRGGTAPMFQKPDASSGVLMNYYRGTRVTVLREIMPGFCLVQTGAQEAGLMGYMRSADLAFGSRAQREYAPEMTMIRLNREVALYSYCDDLAPQIGTLDVEEAYYTIGKNEEKWVQFYAPVGMYLERPEVGYWGSVDEHDGTPYGFARLETGAARGYEHRAIRWEVEPVPGEITSKQAAELAAWAIVNGAADDIPQELRDEVASHGLPFEVTWAYSPPGTGFREVSVNVEYECDAYVLSVSLEADGEFRIGRYEEAAKGS